MSEEMKETVESLEPMEPAETTPAPFARAEAQEANGSSYRRRCCRLRGHCRCCRVVLLSAKPGGDPYARRACCVGGGVLRGCRLGF